LARERDGGGGVPNALDLRAAQRTRVDVSDECCIARWIHAPVREALEIRRARVDGRRRLA
jgi:hypothetical protein